MNLFLFLYLFGAAFTLGISLAGSGGEHAAEGKSPELVVFLLACFGCAATWPLFWIIMSAVDRDGR